MIGGYQILDLRSIDLQKSGSASSITDPYVLKQLLMFRDHIDKAYNFAKPLVNQLKPVLVRFRDKKSGEKTEGATFGELSVDGNYYTFKVTARISGALVLRINVAFEEITNDYGNKEWVIDTATIQLKDESKTITGDLELSGGLSVGGDVDITGDLEADEISGNSIIEKMSGYSAVKPLDITGLEISYAGAVKNGNKLTLAVAFGFEAYSENITNSSVIKITVPSSVMAKLYTHQVGQQTGVLTQVIIPLFSGLTDSVNAYGFAYKGETIDLNIFVSGLTIGKTYEGRFEVTFLLSDNLISNE